MKDLKHEGKQIKSELKAGNQDRGNLPKQQPGAYNTPQKPFDKTSNQPLNKGTNIGGGINNKDKGGLGKVDFNKKPVNKGDKGTW